MVAFTQFKVDQTIRIAVSSCLLGEKVRYDGSDKYDDFIAQNLGKIFEFVSICPEIAIGLGVPRPPIKLEGTPAHPRAVGVYDPAIDVTDALIDYGKKLANELGTVSGFIFKSQSPSCGLDSTEIFQEGHPALLGSGLFALTIRQALPALPVIDEVQLAVLEKRDRFLEQIFTYHQRHIT